MKSVQSLLTDLKSQDMGLSAGSEMDETQVCVIELQKDRSEIHLA